METCRVVPYEGKEKYVFISYCHKDKDIVYSFIEELAQRGCRIWYDEGIQAGSEWPEYIASHIDRATMCIAFISEKSIASHNCQSEINYALLRKKRVISVFLEKVQMTHGMAMQLSSIQTLQMESDIEKSNVLAKIFSDDDVAVCIGKSSEILFQSPQDRNDNIFGRMIEWCDHEKAQIKDEYERQKKTIYITKEEAIEKIKKDADTKIRRIEQESKTEQENLLHAYQEKMFAIEEQLEKSNNEAQNKQYVSENSENQPVVVNNNCEQETVLLFSHVEIKLLRKNIGETIIVDNTPFRIGRSKDKCQYVITNNPAIGRQHIELMVYGKKCFVKDLNSTNFTYVNKKQLQPDITVELFNGDELQLANEVFKISIEENK